jgi:hypothetical protein
MTRIGSPFSAAGYIHGGNAQPLDVAAAGKPARINDAPSDSSLIQKARRHVGDGEE